MPHGNGENMVYSLAYVSGIRREVEADAGAGARAGALPCPELEVAAVMKKLLGALTRNWGLKLASLFLAIVIFYWVRGSIGRSQQDGGAISLPVKVAP